MPRFVCFCRLARRALVETRLSVRMGSRLLATVAWQAESITQTAAESKCQVQDLVHDLLVTQFAGGESANIKC